MKNAIIPMVLSMACAAGLAGTSHAQDFASGNWVAVADGVWEQTSADGTVTRVAHGQAGANHDRQVLEAEITLTQRSDMGAAMLIGRSSIKGSFLVDPGRTFLRSRRPRKTKPR